MTETLWQRPSQCEWFGGTVRPELNANCVRPAHAREYGLVLCDKHYVDTHTDPEDWDA